MSADESPDSTAVLSRGLLELTEVLKCPSCRRVLHNPVILTKCPHVFCAACLIANSSRRCPCCNTAYETADVRRLPLAADVVSIVSAIFSLRPVLLQDQGPPYSELFQEAASPDVCRALLNQATEPPVAAAASVADSPDGVDPADVLRDPGHDTVPKLPYSAMSVALLRKQASRYGLLSSSLPLPKQAKSELVQRLSRFETLWRAESFSKTHRVSYRQVAQRVLEELRVGRTGQTTITASIPVRRTPATPLTLTSPTTPVTETAAPSTAASEVPQGAGQPRSPPHGHPTLLPLWASQNILLPDPRDWHTRGRYFDIDLPPRPVVSRALRKGRQPRLRYFVASVIYDFMQAMLATYNSKLHLRREPPVPDSQACAPPEFMVAAVQTVGHNSVVECPRDESTQTAAVGSYGQPVNIQCLQATYRAVPDTAIPIVDTSLARVIAVDRLTGRARLMPRVEMTGPGT